MKGAPVSIVAGFGSDVTPRRLTRYAARVERFGRRRRSVGKQILVYPEDTIPAVPGELLRVELHTPNGDCVVFGRRGCGACHQDQGCHSRGPTPNAESRVVFTCHSCEAPSGVPW